MRKDAEILGQFDGRGRAEVVLRAAGATRAGTARVASIAHGPGYALPARGQGRYT
ncbi:hypothetical protein [Streptomyces werraensis]|uniref:hypothetical protein n=1 Tax=Streptomyces werraensis TaxID=68284 RepID=UPI0036CA2BC7